MRIDFNFLRIIMKRLERMNIMTNDDTVKLLKECNAGVKMAVTSIDEVLDHIKDEKLKNILSASKTEHEKIGDATHARIVVLQEEDKEPNPVAKAMSWLKINGKLMMNEDDKTIADLMIDGCHMGVKSLNRYLNQYVAADEEAKAETKKLIAIEDQLVQDLYPYL